MRTILNISVENFLSLRKVSLELASLNVLVGPNGSGKTNVLRVFQFLGEVARRDLVPAIDGLDGFDQIRFRGSDASERSIRFELQGIITEHSSANAPDEYKLSFWERKYRMALPDASVRTRRLISRNETIVIKRFKGRGRRITLKGGNASFEPLKASGDSKGGDRRVSVQAESAGLSTIRKLGDEYGASQVEALATVFEELRLYEVDVEKARKPSRSSDPSRLSHDASNIGPYLVWLSSDFPDIYTKLCEDIAYVLPSFIAFHFTRLGGSDDAIRVDIEERHLTGLTPLGRASFGTIRAIALFAMLHDPHPPRMTCLEEVDHGLHPHALDRLVERLREASEKTQLIIATHSPALVNRLSPEELIVLERDPNTGGTVVVDLTVQQINAMKEVTGYELGELWFSGTLGGGL